MALRIFFFLPKNVLLMNEQFEKRFLQGYEQSIRLQRRRYVYTNLFPYIHPFLQL